MLLFPEKYYNPQLDTSNGYWTAKTKSTSFPLSKDSGEKSLLKNVGWETSNTGKLACVRKPIDMRLGPSRVGGAERAIASGDDRFGELTFIFHLCCVVISGKGRSKNKISYYDPKVSSKVPLIAT